MHYCMNGRQAKQGDRQQEKIGARKRTSINGMDYIILIVNFGNHADGKPSHVELDAPVGSKPHVG